MSDLANISKQEAVGGWVHANKLLDKMKAKAKQSKRDLEQAGATIGGMLAGAGLVGAATGYIKGRAIQNGEDPVTAGTLGGTIPYTAIGSALVAIGGAAMQYKKPSLGGKALIEAGKAGLSFHAAVYAATITQEMMFAETVPAQPDGYLG